MTRYSFLMLGLLALFFSNVKGNSLPAKSKILPVGVRSKAAKRIFKADINYGFVGVSETARLDDPFDNVFHIKLPYLPANDEVVVLKYQLKGVSSHTSIARSVNDGQATGGYLVKTGNEWLLQEEIIASVAIHKGDNVVRFGLPAGAGFHYEVKEVSLYFDKRATGSPLILNQPDKYAYDKKAYLKGVLNARGKLYCNNEPVQVQNGEFEVLLNNTPGKTGPFTALLRAELSSGNVIKQTVTFEESQQIAAEFTPGIRGKSNYATYNPAKVLKLTLNNRKAGATIRIPAKALAKSTTISLMALRPTDLPAMNVDLVNVTPGAGGFRFLPHGSRFTKAAQLSIPCDSTLFPEGYTQADVRTFYFDEDKRQWVQLPADKVKPSNGVVQSVTKHFTDMINGIIKVPESPQTQGYTPTSIKDLKAADPSAGIALIAPPSANSMGSAAISFPVKLPKGRLGMQPGLNIQYSNEGGNGWLGLGWNLSVPSVGIDTRWGVPRYDALNETETYMLNGEQLAPIASRITFVARTAEKTFRQRIEGSFSRIIRHGSGPVDYWWEVTGKNGMRSYYGGSPATGVINGAVLKDAAGNIAQWALTQTRDLHDNFVNYEYEQVSDPGVAGGSAGLQLYISKIYYTGSAQINGAYRVEFIRDRQLGETQRKDIEISARLGFKMVTADLLRQIKVFYKDELIRAYELQYREGAFYKTLLSNIRELDDKLELFNEHSLTYYDDAASSGGLVALENAQNWLVGNDQIKGDLINPLSGFSDESSALSTSKSSNSGGAVAVTIGFDDLTDTKSNTVGASTGHESGQNEGLVSMIDINGDGLPDKVFKKSGAIWYRANLGGGSKSFSEVRPVAGLSNLNVGSSKTNKKGVQIIPLFFSLGYERSTTTSTTTDYFADFNGDGLVDMASGGRVLFNHLVAGNPVFTTESTSTPNPIIIAGNVDPNLLIPDTDLQQSQEAEYPLQDAVRFWRAPFNGTIDIMAPVQLLPPASGNDAKSDGVRASIQIGDQPPVWSVDISNTDHSLKTPVGLTNIAVTKGQKVYFRLQSQYNGNNDEVTWDPVIRYTGPPLPVTDANGKASDRYQASEDFVLSDDRSIVMPKDGTISINGDVFKQVTSDSVVVQAYLKNADGSNKALLVNEALSTKFNAIKNLSLAGVKVKQGELLYFYLKSATHIDRTAVRWFPHYVYTAFDDGSPAINANGSPALESTLAADQSNYNIWLIQAQPFNSTTTNLVTIKPNISSTAAATGTAQLTIKGRDTIYARKQLQITGGTVSMFGTLKMTVKPGEDYYAEYTTDDPKLAAAITAAKITIEKEVVDNTGPTPVINIVTESKNANLYTNPENNFLGTLFRGWGQFSYKGNTNNAGIDESKLNLTQWQNYPTNPDAYKTEADFENLPDPTKADVIPMYADAKRNLWAGLDTSVYIKAANMSSSRLWLHDVSVDPLMAGASLNAAYKVQVSKSNSYSLGGGYSGISGGASYSTSSSSTRLDMMDMNGDRYPDVLTDSYVQYTLPGGGLQAAGKSHGLGGASGEGTSIGGSLGGDYPVARSTNKTSGIANDEPGKARATIGLNGNVGTNEQQSTSIWLDINGDGLPDKVFNNGRVSLNIGYGFLPPEDWGIAAIDKNNSNSVSGGAGINIVAGSIQAGFSLSRSGNVGSYTLADVNGDGLADQVSANGVCLNKGNGFGPQISWPGLNSFSNSVSTGESVNAAFTYVVHLGSLIIIPIKICINPSVFAGHGLSREQDQIMDIDGDGLPDVIHSDNDGQLQVKRSLIGRTNMLREIRRPMGGFFAMDYEKVGNTYDMPQSKWVLKNLLVFDGVKGDGMDTLRNSFTYSGGRYDRREREFLGFKTVRSNQLYTGTNNAIYRTTVQEFTNTGYYTKGLPEIEWMEDAAGKKYTQTTNRYDLRDLDEDVKFPALVETGKQIFEGQATANITTGTKFEYDALGNVSKIFDQGDGSPGDMLMAAITYHDNDARYIKSIPAEIQVTTTLGLKRKRSTKINNFGDITQISQFLADNTSSVYDMVYDSYGNLSKITRPGNAKNERLWYAYSYDDEVQTYVAKVTDAYGYSSTSSYEYHFGNVVQTLNMNKQPMRYTFDNRGRMLTVTGPYELADPAKPYTIKFEYFPDAAVPYAITHHYDPEHGGNINTVTFMDGLGRPVQVKKHVSLFTAKNAPDELKMVVSGKALYDSFGRQTTEYYPLTESLANDNGSYNTQQGLLKVKTDYDVQDRPVKEELADGATSKVTYQAQSGFLIATATDALGNATQTLTDVRGRKREENKLSAPGGKITTAFSYNALSELINVADNNGNNTVYTYDNLGRKTSVKQPDAGLTSLVYDLAGNLTKRITAQVKKEIPDGGAINYLYEYERLTGIDYPRNYQNRVTYKYGSPDMGNRAGRLILQQDATGGLEFYYGPLGEVTKQIRTVMISTVFYTTYVSQQKYDTWNRTTQMSYPDGEVVNYHYNRSGGLQSVDGKKLGSAYKYVDQLGYDEYEQRVFLRYGNGTETTYNYDAQRRRLTAMKATTLSGRAMMDNAYQYDQVSNILSITNNARAEAGKLGGYAAHTYTYDKLYRLTNAKGLYQGAKDTARYDLAMEYDNLYNVTSKRLTSKPVVNSYAQTYTYGGTPHQATAIGATKYTYDLNGNQLGTAGKENFWDEDNRLMAVKDNYLLSEYTYDASGERIVKSSGGVQGNWINGAPAGAINHYDNYTVYVSPYLVCRKTTFTKHIYVEGQRIATKVGNGNFDNISFPQSALTAGGVNYLERAKNIKKERMDYYASLGVSPGPPTNKLFFAEPQNSKIAAPILLDNNANAVPAGWPGNITPPSNGPPIYTQPIPSNDSVKAGYGFKDAGQFFENFQYFYHPDHLGSTSYTSNVLGEIGQHVEYSAFGETLFDEHNSSLISPYLFNAKEKDAETGLYYYGARYYNPQNSQWLSIDPMADKYPGLSPYNYVLNNPVRLIDPDGRAPDISATVGISFSLDRGAEPYFKASIDQPIGDSMTASYGFGATYRNNFKNTGVSGIEYRNSGMLSIGTETNNASLGTNFWSGFDGQFNQQTGIASFEAGRVSASYSNDGMPFGYIGLGDGNDRWRSAAATLSIDGTTLGLDIFTGNRNKSSFAIEEAMNGGPTGKPFTDANGTYYPHGMAVVQGSNYNYSALTLTRNGFTIGNDASWIQNYIQNQLIHGIVSPQPGLPILQSHNNLILGIFGNTNKFSGNQ